MTAKAMTDYDHLGQFIDARHPEQVEFLRQIVRVPSDTPPGDNAPAAEKAAELLTKLGFDVERHPVPTEFLRGYGMKSITNLIVRHRFRDAAALVQSHRTGIAIRRGIQMGNHTGGMARPGDCHRLP